MLKYSILLGRLFQASFRLSRPAATLVGMRFARWADKQDFFKPATVQVKEPGSRLLRAGQQRQEYVSDTPF